jgi:hypothetical protein
MPAEQIDIFNKETRPVSFADANEPKLGYKTKEWFWAMILACLFKIVSLLKGTAQVPQVLSFSMTENVSMIRDSTSAARVRITNHGPGTVWITYGEVPPTAPAVGVVVPVASAVIAAYTSEEPPCPVLGKIRGLTYAGDAADVTLTIFCP